MPTEDYSQTRRTARIRQIASLKGLNKVVRAIDSETQLVIKQGGILNVMKTPTGLRSDCTFCRVISSDAKVLYIYFISEDTCVSGYTSVRIYLETRTYCLNIDDALYGDYCYFVPSNGYNNFVKYADTEYEIAFPYKPSVTFEDVTNIFPSLIGFTQDPLC
jgi:hypothetical protein